MHWIILPFRGEETAKTRLAPHLSDATRRLIARAMFQHVLNVSCSAAGARHVLVVTPSASAAQMARRAGAAVHKDSAAGVNAAARAGCEWLKARGQATATVVASDLPLIGIEHVRQLTEVARRGLIGLVRDRSGDGTNALALPLGAPFEPMFGESSFHRHYRQGRDKGLALTCIRDHALGCDVDVAEDLALLALPGALSTLPSALPPIRGAA